MASDRVSNDSNLWGVSDNDNKDLTGLIFKTALDGTLQVEVHAPSASIVQLDPVLIPSSEGVLLDGSASLTAASVYEITFEIVNIDGTNDVVFSVGVDIGAGGLPCSARIPSQGLVLPSRRI